jgi:hypothetical protein
MRTSVPLLAFVLAAAAFGADLPMVPAARQSVDESARSTALRSWKWSLVPLVASQSLDVASSYGLRELNPLIANSNGAFGAGSVAMKAGITGAIIGVEYLIVRSHPRAAKVLSIMNWSSAAITTGVAVHNYTLH